MNKAIPRPILDATWTAWIGRARSVHPSDGGSMDNRLELTPKGYPS